MLSNILLYTVRRLRIALAQSIQGEYVSLIQKNLVTELENMLNVQCSRRRVRLFHEDISYVCP